MKPALILFLLMLTACDLPRDADATLETVENKTLKVGTITGARMLEYEAELVRQLARDLSARIEWTPGTESELMKQAHNREIHMVIGGLTDDLPWTKLVAFTRPFRTDTLKHVWALPPGENAWLVRVERFIEAKAKP